jgi:hypothetical protein
MYTGNPLPPEPDIDTIFPWMSYLKIEKENLIRKDQLLYKTSGAEDTALARDHCTTLLKRWELLCQVYILAGRLLLPGLQHQLSSRLFHLFRFNFLFPGSAEPPMLQQYWETLGVGYLDFLFKHVEEGDRSLRADIMKTLIQNHEVVEKNVRIMKIIRDHEDSAWNVGLDLYKEAKKELESRPKKRRRP